MSVITDEAIAETFAKYNVVDDSKYELFTDLVHYKRSNSNAVEFMLLIGETLADGNPRRARLIEGRMSDANFNKNAFVSRLMHMFLWMNSEDAIENIKLFTAAQQLSKQNGWYTLIDQFDLPYIFIKAKEFLSDDFVEKTKSGGLKDFGNCHQNAEFLLNYNPHLIAITSLCEDGFGDTYYHSYALDKSNDLVIDLKSNLVIPKIMYDFLYKPKELAYVSKAEKSTLVSNGMPVLLHNAISNQIKGKKPRRRVKSA